MGNALALIELIVATKAFFVWGGCGCYSFSNMLGILLGEE
jgi:hypothetical protein